jgi:hypothetical protein
VANAVILKRLAEIDRTLLEHESSLLDLYEKLLLQPPPAPPQDGSLPNKGESVCDGHRNFEEHSACYIAFKERFR